MKIIRNNAVFISFSITILFLIVVFVFTTLKTAKPGAGEEAVLIKKPLIFGKGGVVSKPITTGRVWCAPTTQVVYVNMQPQQFRVHFDDLMSLDGVPLDFDSVIRLRVTDSVKLIQNYGKNWYKTNIEMELQNRVRQAVRKHGMNETAISTKAIDEIDDEVSKAMAEYIKNVGIPVELLQVTIGKANPPDAIKTQRIATAEQQQRILTEEQRKLAEDARKSAEMSRASADNAYREAMQLSPDQFLQLQRIKMLSKICNNGSCTFFMTDDAKELPVKPVLPLQLKTKKENNKE